MISYYCLKFLYFLYQLSSLRLPRDLRFLYYFVSYLDLVLLHCCPKQFLKGMLNQLCFVFYSPYCRECIVHLSTKGISYLYCCPLLLSRSFSSSTLVKSWLHFCFDNFMMTQDGHYCHYVIQCSCYFLHDFINSNCSLQREDGQQPNQIC